MTFDDQTTIMIDCCVKLHRGLYISGWLHSLTGNLSDLKVAGSSVIFQDCRVGVFHGGVVSLGADKGFNCQLTLSGSEFPTAVTLTFSLGATTVVVALADLLAEAQGRQLTSLSRSFFELANAPGVRSVLDVGGRARSQVDRSRDFPGKDVTVLDILPGDNVTVVGDAHDMSAVLPESAFDAFISVSVFEHLLMPWKVVLEINRALKTGGIGMVHTHQTLGMHDMPWDFWRFSDTAWDALFNNFTGFEILERALTYPSHILPLIYRDDKATAEQALGYEGSTVLVRKTGAPKVSWNVHTQDITTTMYPTG